MISEAQSLQSPPPSIDSLKIAPDQAPQIDGNLSDIIWRSAPLIKNFSQINPHEGDAPSEKTEIRFLYTESHLYIAARMFDSSPEDITARVMTRDTDVNKDDHIQFFIDSFNTRRDSQFFMVSPTGARRDGLTENNRKYAPEWDTIWNAKTRIDDEGWTAELAIPFRSFSYDAQAPYWGLQVRRYIARRDETIAWSQITQDLPDFDVSNIGRLTGIRGTEQGRGLDVQGFVTAQATYDWQTGDTRSKIDPSANIYYHFTPSLTGTVTLNTDFSDTPLDPRHVNTDRFSLFFPETRDFFLQDQSVFAFGGRPFRSVNGLPFFSRRIGIVGGLPVDIEGGAKLSGALGPLNIGALSTRTGRRANLGAQTLSVLRLSTDIGDGTRIGMIATDGDPTGQRKNTVWGLDGQYKNTTIFKGKNFVADGYYLTSHDETIAGNVTSGESYGFEIAYPNDTVNWFIRAKHFDEDYDPALGFTNRNGIRDYDGQFRLRKRYQESDIRYDTLGLFVGQVDNLSGQTESGQIGAYGARVWQDGSNFFAFVFQDTENLNATFNLPGGASIPAGDYDWLRYDFLYDTGPSRAWRISTEVEFGNWYDGTRELFDIKGEYRPSKHINLKAGYRHNDIKVSGGDVQIKVFSGDIILNVTPDMQFSSQIQYDNISEGLGYFGRFRWAIRPQTELLLTYSHGAQADFDDITSVQSGLSLRLGNTYRF